MQKLKNLRSISAGVLRLLLMNLYVKYLLLLWVCLGACSAGHKKPKSHQQQNPDYGCLKIKLLLGLS